MDAKKLRHARIAMASGAGSCTRNASLAASEGCAKATVTTASMGGCESVKTAAAGHAASTAVAAGAGSCCESAQAVKTAASASCCESAQAVKTAAMGEGCDEAKTAARKSACTEAKTAAVKTAVDDLPYAENRRVVLAGSYACGHCALGVTEECAPMLKTADGKVYPMINSARVDAMRAAKLANGVEVSGLVKKLDGVKYIDVKSYRAL
jgi:hypothetical protein